MKRFHVYGVGNALVDIDFEVSHDTLSSLAIDKGVMTLIDENKHHQLLDKLKDVPHVQACGGSAANTMIALRQFGGHGFYSCKVANDDSGTFYLKDLLSHGLETNLGLENRQPGVTGKCIVMVTPDADRTMISYLGITEAMSVAELDEIALKASQYLYLEGYLVTSSTGRQAAIKARKIAELNNVKTALTLSDPNMTRFFAEGLKEMIGRRVNLLFCNEEEALIFTQTSDLSEACQSLKQHADKFVVTQGAKGALLFDGNTTHAIQADDVDALDTVGAGDMFAGAFLYAITHGYSDLQAANMASIAAAKVVAKIGPRLNHEQALKTRREIKDRMALDLIEN